MLKSVEYDIEESQDKKTNKVVESDHQDEETSKGEILDDEPSTMNIAGDNSGYDTMEDVRAAMKKMNPRQGAGASNTVKHEETMTITRKYEPGTIPNEANYDEIILKQSTASLNNNLDKDFMRKELKPPDANNKQPAYEEIPLQRVGHRSEGFSESWEEYDHLQGNHQKTQPYSNLSLEQHKKTKAIHKKQKSPVSERPYATIDGNGQALTENTNNNLNIKMVNNVLYNNAEVKGQKST